MIVTEVYYEITFRAQRIESGWWTPPAIRISQDQYNGVGNKPGIRSLVNDYKFLEINGQTVNTAEINFISRKTKEVKPMGTVNGVPYYTGEEQERILKGI